MIFISILILIFILLIFYEIFINIYKPTVIEGLDTYTDYSSGDTSTNAMILAQQNAGNIAYLKQQVDDLLTLKTTVNDLTDEVSTMTTQISDLAQQQADYATSLVGDSTIDVSGTSYDTTTTTS